MKLEDDQIKLLAELAFMAGSYGMLAQSDAIAAGLEKVRPDSERPHIIRAVTRLNQKDIAGAERILRDEALKINPSSAIAKAHLGLALHMDGRSGERDRVLNEVIAAADDEDAVALARQLVNT